MSACCVEFKLIDIDDGDLLGLSAHWTATHMRNGETSFRSMTTTHSLNARELQINISYRNQEFVFSGDGTNTCCRVINVHIACSMVIVRPRACIWQTLEHEHVRSHHKFCKRVVVVCCVMSGCRRSLVWTLAVRPMRVRNCIGIGIEIITSTSSLYTRTWALQILLLP